MNSYYGVQRSTDHLAHYGVKGMRWGVRKALATGNERALAKHYRKAAKKLAKLQDIGLNSKKYAAKATAYGVAATGTGTLAVGGTGLISRMAKKPASMMAANFLKQHPELHISKGAKVVSSTKNGDLYKRYNSIVDTPNEINKWGNRKVGLKKKRIAYKQNADGSISRTHQLSNNDLYRIGTGLVTAGLAAKSAQNAYRASHGAKYREKAVQWKNEMDSIFAGTPYEGHYEKVRRRRRRG